MSVFTPKIKLEFVTAQDKIEKWSKPLNDNFIKLDAFGAEILSAMLPYGSLREAIEKNAGTNVDATTIFFPDNIQMPDVGDGVKRPITSVIQQLANNKMSVDNPAVRTGSMKVLSGSATVPGLKFGDVFDIWVDNGSLVFAKNGLTSLTLVDKGAEVENVNEFKDESVLNMKFLTTKGFRPHWAGKGLKYVETPQQHIDVVGNTLKGIKIDDLNGVEMDWTDFLSTTVAKLDDIVAIKDSASGQFRVITKKDLFGKVGNRDYRAKFDPTTGAVIGDPLNTVLNPTGPVVADGEFPGNVSYSVSKNGTWNTKQVIAGQEIYWNTVTSTWELKSEFNRVTSFTGANAITYIGDYSASYGQYNADLVQFSPLGVEDVKTTSTSVQAAIEDLAKNKFGYKGGVITGDVTIPNLTISGFVSAATAPTDPVHLVNKQYADATFALMQGDAGKTFKVANPVGPTDAVNKQQMSDHVSTIIADYYTKTETDAKYALKEGDAANTFKVATPTSDDHAVNKKYGENTYAKKNGDVANTFSAASPLNVEHVVTKGYMEENAITGASAGKGLLFTPGGAGTPATLDVEIETSQGLGFQTIDETARLKLDYENLTWTQSSSGSDFLMVYDAFTKVVRKVNKADFLGTLASSLRLRGSWNPNTNVVIGDIYNSQINNGIVPIPVFLPTSTYTVGTVVSYTPPYPAWNLASAYSTGDIVEKGGLYYAANDTIPANTAFVEGVTGATWNLVDVEKTYQALVPIAAGAWNPTQWKEVNFSGVGPVAPAGDNPTGFAYSVSADGSFALDGVTPEAFLEGDQIVWTGSAWILVPDAQAVKSVFGRTGIVVAAFGDYSSDLVTYTRAAGKQDILAATADVFKAINDLDDKKVSLTRTQTIAGNKTFSGTTSFTIMPKYTGAAQTAPVDQDLISSKYLNTLLANNDYVSRIYTSTVAKPINWTIVSSSISLTQTTMTVDAGATVAVQNGGAITIKTGSTLTTEGDGIVTIGNGATTATTKNLVHAKGIHEVANAAQIEATGKIRLKYTPSNDDDAVYKKWVEDLFATNNGNYYTKTETDAKYYLKTGGAVSGWGTFKATATEQYGLKVLDLAGAGGLQFLANSGSDVSILRTDGIQLISSSAANTSIGDATGAGGINLYGLTTMRNNARVRANGVLYSDLTPITSSSRNIAMGAKVLGGNGFAGLWAVVDTSTVSTTADLDDNISFLTNNDSWTIRGLRFNVNTSEGAHCSVVPTLDTHLVNKKFLDNKLILDTGPADGFDYVRNNGSWKKLTIAAATYWGLSDLPQKLKDLVASAGVDNDATPSKMYAQFDTHARAANGTAIRVYQGNRAAAGSAILDINGKSATEVELKASNDISILATLGAIKLSSNSATVPMTITSFNGIQMMLGGNGNREISLNHDAGSLTGVKNTVINVKGGKAGTDQRSFLIRAADAGSTGLEINPGWTILDGSAGKQVQIIPDGKTADALYYDTANTRWNFRKIPQMASAVLNIDPTLPEEFVTKKYVDAVAASSTIAAGLEGQVLTMGATTWAGKYPSVLATVKEASAINLIRVDPDVGTTGKILIQGSSAEDGSKSTTAKGIQMIINGTGVETYANSRNILIKNYSALGQIDIEAVGPSTFKSQAGSIVISGISTELSSTGLNYPVRLRGDVIHFQQKSDTNQVVRFDTNATFSDQTFPNVTKNQMTFSPSSQETEYWSSLGRTPARGNCKWDEIAVTGIVSQHGSGVEIQAIPEVEWNDASVTSANKRLNRRGTISIVIPKVGSADAPMDAAKNAILIQAQNKGGQIRVESMGSNGQVFVGTGQIKPETIGATSGSTGQHIYIGSGNKLFMRSTGTMDITSNQKISLLVSNAAQFIGVALETVSSVALNFDGVAPATGKNLALIPQGTTAQGRTQLGYANLDSTRFQAIFARGFELGESGGASGSMAFPNKSGQEAISLMSITPTQDAANAAYGAQAPTGHLNLVVLGTGAETLADARHIKLQNFSKFGRIDIAAQPGGSGINESIVNIVQGKGQILEGSVNGVHIRGTNGVFIKSSKSADIKLDGGGTASITINDANTTIKGVVTPTLATDAANKDYVDKRIIVSAAAPTPADGVDGQIWFQYQ